MKSIVIVAAILASALGYTGAAHAYSQEEVNMFAPPENTAKSAVAKVVPSVSATKAEAVRVVEPATAPVIRTSTPAPSQPGAASVDQ
jgi:hypothetical protein